jgi:exonuclease VII small subunit
MFQKLTITLTLILLSFHGSCQVTETTNGYLITRDFAEFIAARFDSLETYKASFKDAMSALDNCKTAIKTAEELVQKKDKEKDLILQQMQIQSQIISSHKRTEQALEDVMKKYKSETRKKRAWKTTAIIAISSTLLTSIILILQ